MYTPQELEIEWSKDAKIDSEKLKQESLQIPELHAKYRPFLHSVLRERRKLEADLKRLRLEKYEHYTKGPSKETKKKGWQTAPQGSLKRDEARLYIDADVDVLALEEKIDERSLMIEFLESIMSMIEKRSFHIQNALNSEKLLGY